MAWIDFKKTCDLFSWIIVTLKMFGIADNVVNMISSIMPHWRVKLFSNNQFCADVNIRRGRPEYPEKNLSEQSRKPTTNSTHI